MSGTPEALAGGETPEVTTEATNTETPEVTTEATNTETPEVTTEATNTETPEETSSLPDFSKFQERIESDGALTDDDYSELSDLGYPKEMVDAYLKGASSGVSEADVASIKEAAGGEAAFDALAEWAGANLSEGELATYNDALTNSDTARMAVEWLAQKHRDAEGFDPAVVVEGETAGIAKADVYTEKSQVTEAMRDKRYGKDKDYTRKVEAKVGRSNLF